MFQKIIGSVISEQQWNKDSNTPRDYSKEYNAPGSKEQDERNKRKRDKRKHDKEQGECPEGEELHHVDGIDGDVLECEPVSKNRGRKEKSRLKKGEIIIKIREHQLRKIIQEETEKVLGESAIDQIRPVDAPKNPPKKKTTTQQDPNTAVPEMSDEELEAMFAAAIKSKDEDKGSGSSIRAEVKK